MISVLILSFNEEKNICECIKSVKFSKDILVFDSFSTDKTRELAEKEGARVLSRIFDNYGMQRQAALEQGQFKFPWLLVLDADERVDAELVIELKKAVDDLNCPFNGFLIRRKDYFLGRWIPYSTLYPTWFLRFFRHEKTHYEIRSVHEHPMVEGTIGELQGHLLHFSFRKGLEEWIDKHRKYARLEAEEGLKMRCQPLDLAGFFVRDPLRRRKALKGLSYRLPFRGIARFFYMMLIKWAFLDGLPGIWYSLMISRYENWVHQEMNRLKKEGSGKEFFSRKSWTSKIIWIFLLSCLLAEVCYYAFSIKLQGEMELPFDCVIVYGGEINRSKTGLAMANRAGVSIFLSETFGGPKDVQEKIGPVKVPITVDHFAVSTDQNARNAIQFLKNGNYKKAILVTSWYHMPRALLLTRLYLVGSRISVKPYYFEPVPPHWWANSDFLLELFRFWGSLGRVGLAGLGFTKP